MAVFAYTESQSFGAQNVYRFSNEIDFHQNFDKNSQTLKIPSSGVYFFSISAGIPTNMAVDYSLVIPNFNQRPALLRTHTNGSGVDTMYRDAILDLKAEAINVRSGGTLYSDAYKLTSLTAFSITDTMKNPRYFYVYQPSGRFSNFGRITFQNIVLNQPPDWDNSMYSYRCPETGVYLLTFSVFVDPADIVRAELNVGNKVYELLREHTNHGMNGGDVLSRTVLSTCNAGDSIYATLNGGVIQGRRELTTGLMGFVYNPDLSKTQNVYWSLSRNSEVVNDGNQMTDYLFTRLDESNFGLRIIQPFGNLYQGVQCQASGWYFVHVTAVAMPRFRMSVYVAVDGVPQIAISRAAAWHGDGMDYLGRSAILKCRQGQNMTVRIGSGHAVGKTASSRGNVYGTTFLGIMLYSDNSV